MHPLPLSFLHPIRSHPFPYSSFSSHRKGPPCSVFFPLTFCVCFANLSQDLFTRFFASCPFHLVEGQDVDATDFPRAYSPLSARLLDILLFEGHKAFYRLALGLLSANQSSLLLAASAGAFMDHLLACYLHANFQPDALHALVAAGFKLSFSRSDAPVPGVAASQGINPFSNVHTPDHRRLESELIPPSHLNFLWSWLPATQRMMDPLLIFSSAKHGSRLKELVLRCAEGGRDSSRWGLVVLVACTNKSVFGFFLPEGLTCRPGDSEPLPSDAFVFRLTPCMLSGSAAPQVFSLGRAAAAAAAAAAVAGRGGGGGGGDLATAGPHRASTEHKHSASCVFPATARSQESAMLSLKRLSSSSTAANKQHAVHMPLMGVVTLSDSVLAVGDNSGGVAVSLNEDLRLGVTQRCAAFGSLQALTKTTLDASYEINLVEVIGFCMPKE